MATGQHEDVPTGREAAIDRIQAIRAQIRPSQTRSSSKPVGTRGAAASSENDLNEEASTCGDTPYDDIHAALAQRDATIAAQRAELAILRREVAAIAARLTTLGADNSEASDDG